MTRSLVLVFCVAMLGALPRWASAADVTLVDNGKSDYVIVVGEKASESEKFAAEELQTHIERISGVKLPIADKPAAGAKAVFLGADVFPGTDAPDWKAFGDDGFVLRVSDSGVVIAGGHKRGTLYGVYTECA